jgi:hypothetical protein
MPWGCLWRSERPLQPFSSYKRRRQEKKLQRIILGGCTAVNELQNGKPKKINK